MGAVERQGTPVAVVYADLTGNGIVDIADLVGVLLAWGDCEECCCLADLNVDGAVSVDDLMIVIMHWS